jgi:3-isopropylmalate/(R)-2-methylmalate dehydratase small subunit
MLRFDRLEAQAAPLPITDVDTDQIFPGRFLKTIKRYGLGGWLFNDLRYAADGTEIADFVLNREPWRHAEILIAHENFGCGSSREHAAWALRDFGIRCVIAPSFADIFFNNCFKNGILPVVLPRPTCDLLIADAQRGADALLVVDLDRQLVMRANDEPFAFAVDPLRKHRLLMGLDDIEETLQQGASISEFERHRDGYPPIGRGADGALTIAGPSPQAPRTA